MRAKFEFCEVPDGLGQFAVVIVDTGAEHGLPHVRDDWDEVQLTLQRVLRQLGEPENSPVYVRIENGVFELLNEETGQEQEE